MKLFHAVGRARLAVDALGVEAVHLHMLQHHLQHHGYWVLITDQATHSHPEVLTARLLVTLWIQNRQQQSVRSLSSPLTTTNRQHHIPHCSKVY